MFATVVPYVRPLPVKISMSYTADSKAKLTIFAPIKLLC
nr:MAG TPA: hypothetical protein [Caudoviricetes sp.]